MSAPWSTAEVTRVQPAADGLFTVELSAAAALGAGYARPGQYLAVAVDGLGEGYFALASAPGERPLELLVRAGTPLTEALIASSPGDAVRLSGPLGAGFPVERARGGPLLLFATGSGIGAMRALVRTVCRDRSAYGPTTLYFGARTPDGFAYAQELPEWEAAGVRVVRTVSQPGATGWAGLTGYVQGHLGELAVNDAVAFVVGQPAMVAEVTQALEARGLPRERVFLNH